MRRRRFLHGLRQHVVGCGPGRPRLRREGLSQATLERPQQRNGDDLVVPRLHAVGGVAAPELPQRDDDLLRLAEPMHGNADHGGQVAALLPQVVLEQPSHFRIQAEELAVEKLGGCVSDWLHLAPGHLHEADLLRAHRYPFPVSDSQVACQLFPLEKIDSKEKNRTAPGQNDVCVHHFVAHSRTCESPSRRPSSSRITRRRRFSSTRSTSISTFAPTTRSSRRSSRCGAIRSLTRPSQRWRSTATSWSSSLFLSINLLSRRISTR